MAPNKKLKTISAEFKKTFGVTLAFYKGVQLADGELTLNQLNRKTTKDVKTNSMGVMETRSNLMISDFLDFADDFVDKSVKEKIQHVLDVIRSK